MNKGNKLLGVLDKIYGVAGRGISSVKRVVQKFDRQTGEHVVVFEYRVKEEFRSDEERRETTQRRRVPRKEPESQLELLQDINRRAVLRKSPTKGPQER